MRAWAGGKIKSNADEALRAYLDRIVSANLSLTQTQLQALERQCATAGLDLSAELARRRGGDAASTPPGADMPITPAAPIRSRDSGAMRSQKPVKRGGGGAGAGKQQAQITSTPATAGGSGASAIASHAPLADVAVEREKAVRYMLTSQPPVNFRHYRHLPSTLSV